MKTIFSNPMCFIEKMKSKITIVDKFSFFITSIMCFVFHMFMYTNVLYVHDSSPIFNSSTGITNGRFFISVLAMLTDRLGSPWLIGLLAVFFYSLAVVFTIRILGIDNKIIIFIISSFMVGNPIVIASHAYMSSIYMYAFALFMSVLAVYFVDKGKTGILFSSLCIILSLSTYQAYISFTLCLLIIKLIKEIIETDIRGNKILLRGLKYIAVSVFSLVLYYIIWQCIMNVMNLEIVNYRGYSDIANFEKVSLLERIFTAFAFSVRDAFSNTFDYHVLAGFFYIATNVLAIVLTLFNIYDKHKTFKGKLFWTMFALTLMFIAISFIYIVNPLFMHLLMIYSNYALFLLFMLNFSYIEKKNTNFTNGCFWVVILFSIISIINFASTSNGTYTNIYTHKNNAISYCTRIIDKLEKTEGFTKDTKVVVIDEDEDWIQPYNESDWHKDSLILEFSKDSAITYLDTFEWFITQQMSVSIDISMDVDNKFANMPEVKALESFPSENCTAWVGDTLVLKLK